MPVTPADRSAEFVALWNANSRRVYAYIYSLVGNWADADDLFQETGLAVLSKFDEYEPGTHFGAWACRIAYHKVLMHFRERRSAPHLDEVVLEALRDQSLAMSNLVPAQMSALNECLRQLPSKDRALLRLRYFCSTSVAKIANKIRRTPSAVYKALARVHELLLECIEQKMAQEDAE